MSRIITSNRIKQEISEKTFTDESLAELDDIINEYIHNQKEQEMIKLLKENLEKILFRAKPLTCEILKQVPPAELQAYFRRKNKVDVSIKGKGEKKENLKKIKEMK